MMRDCDDPAAVHKFCSMLPAFVFEARQVIAIEEVVRIEPEAIAFRDGLKASDAARLNQADVGSSALGFAPNEDAHQFPAFAARVGVGGDPLLLKREVTAEAILKLMTIDGIWRAFTVALRIEEKDRDEAAAGREQPNDSVYVIVPPRGIDRAEAGVLEDDVEPSVPLLRQGEEVTELVFLVADFRPRVRLRDGGRRQIDSNDVILRRAERAHVVTGTAARHEDLSGEWTVLREEIDERRMRLPFFPRRFAALIGLVPIGLRLFHGSGLLAASRMAASFSNAVRR